MSSHQVIALHPYIVIPAKAGIYPAIRENAHHPIDDTEQDRGLDGCLPSQA